MTNERMTNDERMSNDQCQMTNRMIRHSDSGILWSFVIRHSSFLCVSVPLWLVFFCVGCGARPVTEVTGKVAYEGQPLNSGKVIFYGKKDWRPRSGRIQEDGSYTVQNVPVGVAFISVENRNIPQKYAVVAHSDLKCEVQEGGTTYDIELTGVVEQPKNGRRASR